MDGIRSSKTADGKHYDYITQNGKVVREYVTNASTGAFIRCLDFFYDYDGQPFAMWKYKNSSLTDYDTYHYVLNAQGDVVQINYQGGTVYATYTYDAWGRVLSATGDLANINPLRYRGYYYDTETGWYYLQSRYYDPIVKRFLNADVFASTGQGFLGYNMFAYCINNPVMQVDYYGDFAAEATVAALNWWNPVGWILAAVVAIEVAVIVTVVVVEAVKYVDDAIDRAIVDSKTKTAGGGQAKTTPSTSTPASPNNGNNKNNKKQTRRSDKEKSTDKPSWVNRNDVDFSQTPQQNATRLMNQKYGMGNWTKGSPEYSQIVKWIQRSIYAYLK